VTVELDAASLPDMVRAGGGPDRCLWSSSDLSLLGVGRALRLPLGRPWASRSRTARVEQALRAISRSGEPCRPGTGPVAMGALPYDPGLGGELSVPRLVVGHGSASAWATLTVPAETSLSPSGARRAIEAEVAALRDEVRSEDFPDGFDLTASMPHEQWKQLVSLAIVQMERGTLAKVVLARRVDVVANRPFVLHEVLARLSSLYPSCAVFHFEGFIGASPETLVRRTGHRILSHPLAGTIARSGDSATDETLLARLMASPKDRREHQLVVDAIAAKLRPICSQLEVPPAPSALALRNVSHLGTAITGALRADGAGPGGTELGERPPTSLELAAVLQPTPAVGGNPTEVALRWQRDNEGFERGRYAGPVGWLDSCGDGEWALGLRSADVSGCRAALYAGSGIVPGSSPEAELAETQLKLQALLAALVRP
jgi:menaquinone-specific isochorismate synthase